MSKLEKDYQSRLKYKIKMLLPDDCVVLKNDPSHYQGIPDLLILYGSKWAALEVKRNQNAKHRPNQEFYVDRFNEKAFASFIYPENEDEVLDQMLKYFEVSK